MPTIIPETTAAVTAAELKFRADVARMLGELFETYDPAQDTPVLAQARRAVTQALEAGRAFPDLRAIGRRALAELDRLGR